MKAVATGKENKYFATSETTYEAVDTILTSIEEAGDKVSISVSEMEQIQGKLNAAGATLRTKSDVGSSISRQQLMERIERIADKQISIN